MLAGCSWPEKIEQATVKKALFRGAAGGLLWAAAFCFFPDRALLRWFIGLAGLVLLLSLWSGSRTRESPGAVAAGSFMFGFLAFAVGCHWIYYSVRIVNGGPVALAVALVVLLAAVMGAWYALGGFWASFLHPKRRWPGPVLILPSVLILTEWLRGWVFTGFPWLSAGYLTGPVFAGKWPSMLAPVGGLYLIGWITAMLAGASLLVLRWKASAGRRALGLLLLLGGAAGLGQFPSPGPDLTSTESMLVRLVQGGIPQERKWLPEELWPTLLSYETMSFGQPWGGVAGRRPELIVWPEMAVPATRDSVSDYLDEMDALLGDRNMALAVGILTDTEAGRFNSLLMLGSGSGVYHKSHLVPFGEFFPVPDAVRDWLLENKLPANDLLAGDSDQAPLEAGETVLGVSICYEAAFGAEQRAWLPESEILINISNDGWFGDTVALEQHLDMARMRAMESKRYLLRVTGTGITAAVDPSGRLVSRLPKYEGGFLDVRVPRLSGTTPFVRYGDWPIVVLCLLFGIAFPAAVALKGRAAGYRPSPPSGGRG